MNTTKLSIAVIGGNDGALFAWTPSIFPFRDPLDKKVDEIEKVEQKRFQ